VGLSPRTAQAYMRVANWAFSKSATVALLPPTALYVLASSGVPAEFVEEVLRRVEDGESIQLPSLRAQVKALRETTSQPNGRSADGEVGDQSGDALHVRAAAGSAALILNAVRILARGLTASDFAHVREIITSQPVLGDPNLPRLIERAFEAYQSVPDATELGGSLMIFDQPIRSTRTPAQRL
jgi:hypothetical protein